MKDPYAFFEALFTAGLSAADPLKVVPRYLPEKPKGRVIVIGAGKASAAMAKAVEQAWQGEDISGYVVTRYDYGVKTDHIEIVEAAHPVPDSAGEKAADTILDMVSNLTEDDLVLCLISGGGSALLTKPAPCLTAPEKQAVNKALLRSGATIHEMNCVRKHLSAIKGGQLACAAYPARLHTLIISDVPGDDPAVVASGPTLADPSTQAQALAVIDKYNIPVTDKIRDWLSDPANETPKPGDERFAGNTVEIIAKAQDALEAASSYAQENGILPLVLGDDLEGEARVLGAEHIQYATENFHQCPCVILSGGETTVTVQGNGRGGRNTEYLLGALIAANGNRKIYALACDTDGIDGSEDNAGAIFGPDTFDLAHASGLDPQDFLKNNDAYSFFEGVNGLIKTGPTFTNVNDFRAILVL